MKIAEKDSRLEAIEKLVNKHFTLYSPLEKKLDDKGHLCYGNKELTIYDCLFYLNITTCLGDKFSVHQSSNLVNGYNRV